MPPNKENVRIGQRTLGLGYPCMMVAEIGINHNGSVATAHDLIDAAADAGADTVKFQNFRTEDVIIDKSLTWQYESAGRVVTESQSQMFKRYELPVAELVELRSHCHRRNVDFVSTPGSEQSLAELLAAGCSAIKNGSDYLVHLPLIRAMARSGLPAILSVGMATLSDIDEAVRAFRGEGGKDLILLHCTSAYPAPPGDVNLRRIETLRASFQVPVGFSDHSEGVVASLGAVSLGACMIEKHFTLDKSSEGPDHSFSADPEEFSLLVKEVRLLELQLGTPMIAPTESEADSREQGRLGCVASRDLPAGRRLERNDLVFRRPGSGALPRDVDWLVGRIVRTDMSVGTPIGRDSVE